jgi:hypothetical protein
MRPPSKIWWRSFNRTWYATIQGEQIPLAKGKKNKRQAERAFHRLLAEGGVTRPLATVDVRVAAIHSRPLFQALPWLAKRAIVS